MSSVLQNVLRPMRGQPAHIRVIVLGGTITMTSDREGLQPTLAGNALISSLSHYLSDVKVTVTSPKLVASPSLSLADVLEVSHTITQDLARDDVDGVVVVQGTDTIEETSFLLHLLLDEAKPIVVTGAMRGADIPGADGPANLLAAIQVAASRRSIGKGVMIVLNDEIHSATCIVKAHTILPSAFQSVVGGPLGLVVENDVMFLRTPCMARGPRLVPTKLDAPVALLKIGMSDDGRLLKTLPQLGFQGLVIEAMGAGHVPESVVEIIGDLCPAFPVLMSSRTGFGPVLRNTYNYRGSEIDLIQRGVIPTGFLNGLKARLLLIVALSCGSDLQTIQRLVKRYCA